jgi:hypothetical protein
MAINQALLIMQHFTSSHAKQNFGELLKAAEAGPVAVERHRKVQVIVATPAHFTAATQAPPDVRTERKLARMQQAVVERDRLIRHQKIAMDLLTLPPAKVAAMVARAKATVELWQAKGLCSADYIERWRALLEMPSKALAQAMVADADGWGPALRQNSPWVGEQS